MAVVLLRVCSGPEGPLRVRRERSGGLQEWGAAVRPGKRVGTSHRYVEEDGKLTAVCSLLSVHPGPHGRGAAAGLHQLLPQLHGQDQTAQEEVQYRRRPVGVLIHTWF